MKATVPTNDPLLQAKVRDLESRFCVVEVVIKGDTAYITYSNPRR